MTVSEELTQVICTAIDNYRLSQKPNLTVNQILVSIERIRFGLTERALRQHKINS